MSKPLDKHEKAMRLLLRLLRSQIGIQQRFRSITGACFFYRGSVIKAFSRLQQAVALSSCEAELSAPAESIQESMGMRGISEHLFLETHCHISHAYDALRASETFEGFMNHLLFGVQSQDETCEENTVIESEVKIRTDSQAAVRVLSSPGLQRRSRHVELRVCFCQDFVKNRNVILTWVEVSKLSFPLQNGRT